MTPRRRRTATPWDLSPTCDPFTISPACWAAYLADRDGYDHDADQEEYFRGVWEQRNTGAAWRLSTHQATGVSVWLVLRPGDAADALLADPPALVA